MDVNKILTAALLRLINDDELQNLLDGNIRAVKGPRKPTSMDNPCFTLHIPSNSRDPDTKIHTGTLIINFYVDNYPSGNANIELMGPVVNRLIEVIDEWQPDIEGYKIADWTVREPLGPLWDSDDPDEHFSSVRIGFVIQKVN